MTDLVTEVLASSLASVGLFSRGVHTIAGLGLKTPPPPHVERWLSSSISYLRQQNLLTEALNFCREPRPLDELWTEWEARRAAWAVDPGLATQSALLETCLRALPGIVSGTTHAILPDPSLQLTGCSDVLGRTLLACIEREPDSDADRTIRILEIGAGTGGATAGLLPLLHKYPIGEYCLTDLSKGFLTHAETRFRSQCPTLTTAIFDVSKPLEYQSIPLGHYDVAIAANVMHATADVREAVRNAKAALRNQGTLLLAEISAWSLFNHVTFGLLEGWWRYDDAALRLPGCPGLAPQTWEQILTDEGFESICFPAADVDRFGRQVIAAVSNGWTRQRIVTGPSRSSSAVAATDDAQPQVPNITDASTAGPANAIDDEYVRRVITERLGLALRVETARIRDDEPFADYGVDSIVGAGLVRSLAEALQIELEMTSLFEFSTIGKLTQHIVDTWGEHIAGQVAKTRGSEPEPAGAAVATATRDELPPMGHRFLAEARSAAVGRASRVVPETDVPGAERIAVIGMSGRFGESESLDAFWQNLADGKELIKEVSRWSRADCVMSATNGQPYCSRGSFVDSIDRFDPEFFGITAHEAVYMDPQQRLFLEESWRALEDAGYAGESVREQQCGVYVGCGSSHYDRLFTVEPPPQAFWGNSESVTPARIAYHLNLQGPSIAVDTACSSSLVAIHLACQGLWAGETNLALAGGVFLQPTPRFYQVANRAHMLSPDGRCYSFDARANGYVPAEGVGAVVLKRLRDAIEDGDHIHGVIVGSGINQDGRSNGLIAPNGRAQERLARSVYDRFQINPETIQVLEAHATGSTLGDSIEYGAISRCFRGYTERKRFCAIGTVKTNIGHAASAAGIAGVLKLLLSLRHRQIPASLHFQQANAAIDLESGPFYVNTELQPWAVGSTEVRRAAVSAFGFSGTNAHLVLEEPPTPPQSAVRAPGYLFVLSARTAPQLQQQVRRLVACVKQRHELSMNDCSFSLFVGRGHFNHRLCCLAGDRQELIRRLEQWIDTGSAEHVYASEIRERSRREHASLKKFGNHCIQECSTASSAAVYTDHLATIADLYLQGYALDFAALFPPGSRRTPLPTYPFAGERYWIETAATARPESAAVTVSRVDAHQTATATPVRESSAAVATVADEDLCSWLERGLSRLAGEILNLDPDTIPRDRVLLDHGFDSIGLTRLAKAIAEHYRVDMTPVVFFDYPSIHDIAGYLSRQYGGEIARGYRDTTMAAPAAEPACPVAPASLDAPAPGAALAPLTERPQVMSRSSGHAISSGDVMNEPIAIVGMSGVMPQCDDLDEFWENLKSSRDMVTLIPRDRWNWEDYYGDPLKEVNKSNSKWGGFLREIDKFDPLFFGISPREARMMDPQQRIFLEHVWKSIEDSGQKVSDLSGTRTGVFVGVAGNDYLDLMRVKIPVLDGYSVSGNSYSILANRVSFLLNLRGPSAPVDTACSSALVALHRAVESIHAGSSDMAIVGGVHVMLSPAAYVSFGIAGMLSSDGKCKVFDKTANGYVRGEGCGVIFLKKLSAARADGNPIYAIVKGTAENHGGRVTTMTAPNAVAQSVLVVEAFEKAGIDPATVGYIECHGTGTSLGDPIECQALATAFAELYERHNNSIADAPHCGLGSVKTNIGHLEAASGMAGVLKVLLALKHEEIPANLHFKEINPYINLQRTPFYIVDKLTRWEAPVGKDGSRLPRRAGVSSYGFGGANAHIVLEEYQAPARPSPIDDGPHVVVLSAKNEDRLKAYVQSMLAYLDKARVALADFAYTLQVGRDEMPSRLAVLASSLAEVKQKFREFLDDGELPAGVYRNTGKRGAVVSTSDRARVDASIQGLIEQRELSRLAEAWVSGGKVDWKLLHGAALPTRLSLPTYPFARQRYWLFTADEQSSAVRDHHAQTAAALLHPLVHRNVSTSGERKFGSRFTGEEFYFSDHRVEGQKILPGVAYLEMARAAGELSGNGKVRVIRNVTWERPLIVGGDAAEVEISLTSVRNELGFSIATTGNGRATTHCTGRLVYSADAPATEVLDIAAIRARCPELVMSGEELYDLFGNAGLEFGASLRVAQQIYANASESFAILRLPEQLQQQADQYELHPALMEGALHSGIGLLKKSGVDAPLGVPFSVGEVRIFRPLRDLHYGYTTWADQQHQAGQGNRKVNVHLLDKHGTVLVRISDFLVRPFHRDATASTARARADHAKPAAAHEGVPAGLHSVVPVWSPVRFEASALTTLDESTRLLLVGGSQAQLDWIRTRYPNSQLLPLASTSSIDSVAETLADRAFDQLLWVAPDLSPDARGEAEDRISDRQERGVVAVFRIIKALLQSGYANKKLQWTLLTCRTQPVTADAPIQPTHAGVAGLIGSLAKEYPHWDLRLLDLDSLRSVSAQECLSLPWDKQGDVVAHRRGEWFRQELSPVETRPDATPLYRPNGVYVVIGGAGGIGEVWTRFMIERYQANVVWIGRRQCDAAIDAKISGLSRLGPAPRYMSADARSPEALAEACQAILSAHPAIHGVVHSAVVLQDQGIARMDESVFRSSLASKVDISANIDDVFGGQSLDFMLFFSSIVSFLKPPGQSNYSAGSTFEDSFARRLGRERTYPVKVINWGYWGSVGVVADERHTAMMARLGIGSIEPHEGMASLQAFVGSDGPQMALIKTVARPAGAARPAFDAVLPATGVAQAGSRPAHAAAAHATRTIDGAVLSPELIAQATDAIRQVIAEKLSEALKMEADSISGDSPLPEYGVDSIIGVSLIRSINEALQVELEATSLFEYNTVNQLAEYVCTNWPTQVAELVQPVQQSPRTPTSGDVIVKEASVATLQHGRDTRPAGETRVAPHAVEREPSASHPGHEPIAIIGMSGRFAESESLDEFWQNLKDGKDLVKEVSRWSAAECVLSGSETQVYCRHGSFIDSIDRFDRSFFRISALEAVCMDPQQRLFLEECWKALEDAGYAGTNMQEKPCGVYVGCAGSNYASLLAEPAPEAFWGNSESVIPARIAYYLDLHGPTIAVDTACSSSLVAIHMACQGLWSRETDMALAGGVSLHATPLLYLAANRAGMLSPTGKTRSFDARADGFVLGEGVGVVALKRLRDALHDRDHIHGVIAGSGLNQDGRSSSFIAPNGRAQQRLERAVYERFRINPETIQLVEAHGTGTVFGDAIEYGAISRAFRAYTKRRQFCALGTVKTNIGHASTAAGIAGVLKLLLALKHRQIPPTLHFETGNPGIDFESSPFYVNSELKEWTVDNGGRRRGVVSAFAFSGANAHLVIEEAPSTEPAVVEAPGYVVPLSARTAEQLTQQAQNLVALLERSPDLLMNDLSFTLFVGRMHFNHRLACLARGREDLIRLLKQWLKTGAASHVYAAEIREGRNREQATLKRFGNYCIQESRNGANAATRLEYLETVADLYVQGYSLDYGSLFPEASRRIPLPTYPFARERCWVDAADASAPAHAAPAAAREVATDSSREYVAPRNELEEQLVEIWADALNIAPETIGVNDSFFELGAHSLLAAQVIAEIRSQLDVDVPLTALFEGYCVAELAEIITNLPADEAPPDPSEERAVEQPVLVANVGT